MLHFSSCKIQTQTRASHGLLRPPHPTLYISTRQPMFVCLSACTSTNLHLMMLLLLHDVEVQSRIVPLGPAVGGHGMCPTLGWKHGDLVAVRQLGLRRAGGRRGSLGVVELGARGGGASQVLHRRGRGVRVALLLCGGGQTGVSLVRHMARVVVRVLRVVVGVGRLGHRLGQGLGWHVGWHWLLGHCKETCACTVSSPKRQTLLTSRTPPPNPNNTLKNLTCIKPLKTSKLHHPPKQTPKLHSPPPRKEDTALDISETEISTKLPSLYRL